MKNLPQRLKAARLMQGLTMQELASRLNKKISKQSISNYENGKMKPSHQNLLLMCNALGVKPDFFSRQRTVSLGKPSYRKLQKLSVKKQDLVKEKTKDYLERYLEIEEILDAKVKFENKLADVKINDYSDLEEAANRLRQKWNLGQDALFNILEIIEENGIKVFELETDKSFSGMSAVTEEGDRVIVLNNKDVPTDRKRFTALHELGHQLLDLEKFDEKTEEKMCHYFAGAVLLPEETLKRELGNHRRNIHIQELRLLKEEYGISMQAILFRAKNLGIISENHFKEQFIAFSKMGMRKNEPGEFCGKEHSNRFFQLILRAIAEEIITTSKAAALYNMKLAAFRKEVSLFN